MKWLGLFLALLLVVSFVKKGAQPVDTNTESEIIWSSGVKLKWDDFQGAPDSRSSYKAMTTTTIGTGVNEYSDSVVSYKFICAFDKKKSWKKIEAVELLKHEQLHFDMAELAVRKLRKEFSEYRFTSLNGVNAHLKKIFAAATALRKSMGQDYDTETKHGTVEDQQRKWEVKIAEELKKLEAYSGSTVIIRRVKK